MSTCTECTYVNVVNCVSCVICESKSFTWKCAICTLHNRDTILNCQACQTAKPETDHNKIQRLQNQIQDLKMNMNQLYINTLDYKVELIQSDIEIDRYRKFAISLSEQDIKDKQKIKDASGIDPHDSQPSSKIKVFCLAGNETGNPVECKTCNKILCHTCYTTALAKGINQCFLCNKSYIQPK